MRTGRKFIAFLLCLLTFIILGVWGKGEGAFPFIIALYGAYVTSNVTQKATTEKYQDGDK